MLRDELGDVVYLKVVLDARDEGPGAGGLPAVVVTCLEGGAERFLGLVGEAQDGLADGELGVDVFLAEAMSFDIEEA